MSSDDPDKLKDRIAALEAENQELRDQLDTDSATLTKRNALKAGGLLAGVPALSLLFGSASAQTSNTFPVAGDDALTKIRADRLRLVPRSSAVSSPPDGLLTYRSDL